jgi:hypothetical protein
MSSTAETDVRKPAFLIGVFLALVLITPAASQQMAPPGAKPCLTLQAFTARVEARIRAKGGKAAAALAAHPDKVDAKIAERFAALDANHDGCLTGEEIQAAKKK